MLSVLPIILGVQFLLLRIVLDVQNIPTKPVQLRSRRAASLAEQLRKEGEARDLGISGILHIALGAVGGRNEQTPLEAVPEQSRPSA